MKIVIASDHAGFELKQKVVAYLKTAHEVVDLGPSSAERCDYPDYADQVVRALGDKIGLESGVCGILICGSGQGMAMRANKYSQVRAALCWNREITELSRQHNDANILCMGSRLISESTACELADVFISTSFEGGRHADRVKKLSVPHG